MPISKNHHDLFHNSDTLDKINLFQSLLDSQDITSMEALALLNTIHMELGQPQEHAPVVYERYAEMMEALRRKNPDIHEEVIRKWSDLQFILKTRESRRDDSSEDFEADVKDGNKRQAGYEAPQQKVVGGLPQKPTAHVDEDSEVGREEEAEGEGAEEEAEEKESEEKESEKEEIEEEKEEEAEEETEGKEKEESKEEDAEEESEKEENEEKEKDEVDEEVEEKEEEEKETEKEETEIEEESDEGKHEEKEEAEEEVEKGEEVEKAEHEVEHEEHAEEADHMIGEAAEALQESEHTEMHESESSVEIEETDLNIAPEEEPPMEPEG